MACVLAAMDGLRLVAGDLKQDGECDAPEGSRGASARARLRGLRGLVVDSRTGTA